MNQSKRDAKPFERSAAIILAAGEGKRMKSKRHKVLHPLGGVPIIFYLLKLVQPFSFEKVIIVIGHQADQMKAVLKGQHVQTVLQSPPRGTGDAVSRANPYLKGFTGPVLILNGDTPLITTDTLIRLWETHRKEKAVLSLLTASFADPTGYGRIIRAKDGTIDRIIEEKDATDRERQIQEGNAGTYLVESRFLFDALTHVAPHNQQNEYYLTDIVKVARTKGARILGVQTDAEEVLGINSRADLAEAEKILQRQIVRRWMEAGVTIIDPTRVRIDAEVTIGQDTILHPGVTLEGKTKIGKGATLYACRIKDSDIGDDLFIRDQSVIEGAIIESGVTVGPFAHLRPGTVLRKGVRVGNFVEIKKSELGEGSKANHLTYLGDAHIGKGVNIGAGTITCNFDGRKKYETVIEDDVFVGSDTQLIAPVRVGARSLIAAGSTITKDVEPDSLAISRVKQVVVKNWVKKKKRE